MIRSRVALIIVLAFIVSCFPRVQCNFFPEAKDSPINSQQLATTVQGSVNDYAEILAADSILRIESTIEKLEKNKRLSSAILIVETTNGIPIEDFSLTAARQWDSAGHIPAENMSMLIVIATRDGKIRIEADRKLAQSIRNDYFNDVIATTLVPAFKKRQFESGIKSALQKVERKL